MYGDHSTEHGMLMGGDLDGGMLMGSSREEELGFGKWFKKVKNKVRNTVGNIAGDIAKKELQRRLGGMEEDLTAVIMELNDNQEENLICRMDIYHKCYGLKTFMSRAKTLGNAVVRKQIF